MIKKLSIFFVFFTTLVLAGFFYITNSQGHKKLIAASNGEVRGVNVEYQENIMNIPLYTQSKNLSCEAAAIRMVLSYLGKEIKEEDIQNQFPISNNPDKGFRGNVEGGVWGFSDYGAHPNAVAEVIRKFGISATPYKFLTEADLKKKIGEGKPVIIWVNITNPNPQIKQVKFGLESTKLVSGEHTVVVKGFKNGKWYINDPWIWTDTEGDRRSDSFTVRSLQELNWNLFDNGAVVIE